MKYHKKWKFRPKNIKRKIQNNCVIWLTHLIGFRKNWICQKKFQSRSFGLSQSQYNMKLWKGNSDPPRSWKEDSFSGPSLLMCLCDRKMQPAASGRAVSNEPSEQTDFYFSHWETMRTQCIFNLRARVRLGAYMSMRMERFFPYFWILYLAPPGTEKTSAKNSSYIFFCVSKHLKSDTTKFLRFFRITRLKFYVNEKRFKCKSEL